MAKKRSTATRRAESTAASARAAAIRREQELKERRRRGLVVATVGVVVLVLIGVIVYLAQSANDTSGDSSAAPTGAVTGYAVPSGPDSAPVKVVVYEDFICPFCGQFEAASRTAFQKDVDQGKVQFQYHVLNFLDRNTTTDYSTRAANALAVVLDTSGPTVAKKFHDLLFENQPAEGSAGLSDSKLVDLAAQAGATSSKVESGIKDRTFEQWVTNVTDKASKDGVTGTPTVTIDGKTLTWKTTGELVTLIEKAIAAG
jgi:protein-disulfide isomerase